MRAFRIREEVLHPETPGKRQRKLTEETEDVYLNRIDR